MNHCDAVTYLRRIASSCFGCSPDSLREIGLVNSTRIYAVGREALDLIRVSVSAGSLCRGQSHACRLTGLEPDIAELFTAARISATIQA